MRACLSHKQIISQGDGVVKGKGGGEAYGGQCAGSRLFGTPEKFCLVNFYCGGCTPGAGSHGSSFQKTF